MRALVKTMNNLMESMDIDGLRQQIRQQPKEAVTAANYVNKKYRYVVQSIVIEELRAQKK